MRLFTREHTGNAKLSKQNLKQLKRLLPRANGPIQGNILEEIRQRPDDEQTAFILQGLGWTRKTRGGWRKIQAAILSLLEPPPQFNEDSIGQLLFLFYDRQPLLAQSDQLVNVLQQYCAERLLDQNALHWLGFILEALETPTNQFTGRSHWRRGLRLRNAADLRPKYPLSFEESWAFQAVQALDELRRESAADWAALIFLCAENRQPTPARGWLDNAEILLDRIGQESFLDQAAEWFKLAADETSTRPNPVNAEVLRGLIWLAGIRATPETARGIRDLAISAYKKLPGIGPRAIKVGNACIWALGQVPVQVGLEHLAIIRSAVTFKPALKAINAALAEAAQQAGLTVDDLEELLVPDYGLSPQGATSEELGRYRAEISQGPAGAFRLSWRRTADQKLLKSVPQAVREAFPTELSALRSKTKDIQKMLAAQKARIEALYLKDRQLPYANWKTRYLDHPLVGVLARRLIWGIEVRGESVAACWEKGEMRDAAGQPLVELSDRSPVRLWHPIDESPDRVLEWRRRLRDLEIRQPFKQAHREIYLLTDAELETEIYSNRFAAHVLKQHQFHALAGVRGWHNSLRLMVDDVFPPARLNIPAWDLRAEFWVDTVGEHMLAETTNNGSFLYVTTDQVRFYPLNAPDEVIGHGYGARFGLRTAESHAIPLANIPAMVFSEAMRDVDLFVGVTSIGNDPNWLDGGREGHLENYWHNYSFGDLSVSAETRKFVLAEIIPNLPIADRCHIQGRFLHVRGQVRTYKIHLGSGNILMEPNDQYLCIVPSSRSRSSDAIFLPFEGDRTLSVILSKVLLLANDTAIKDPTILQQIRR
jgi:hypothetical protein